MVTSARTFRSAGLWARSVAPLAALAVLTLSGDADAAKVKGTVTGFQKLVNPVWDEAKEPERHLYSFREVVPTVRAEFRRLFPHIPKELCVAALAAEKQPPHEPILIRVGGGRATPVTIVVTPGTALQFQNTDPFDHRLYGVNVPDFAAQDTKKGGVRTWKVPGPGTFEIRDEAAPSLRMWVIGEPNVAGIAYPSLKGEFVLALGNPGAYQIQAYFAGKKVGPQIDATVDAADLDLTRRPLNVAPAEKAK